MTTHRSSEGDLGRLAGYRPPAAGSMPGASEVDHIEDEEAVPGLASAVPGIGAVESHIAVTAVERPAGTDPTQPEGDKP